MSLRCLFLLAAISISAPAQWINYRTPGTPRTPDGKPNLSAPVPHAADGHIDLSGVWMHEHIPLAEMERYFGAGLSQGNVPGMEVDTVHKYAINILLDFKPNESPIRPEALAIMRDRKITDFPPTHCLPTGIPFGALVSEPVKLVQSPRLLVVLYEADVPRQVYTDGRELPKEFDKPAWFGYSAGKWDRDTLVVETAGFNDKTWLDGMGHPHSDALHVTERYHRSDFGHMDVEMTFDDPKMYTKPFTIRVPFYLLADADIYESICNENEKDLDHMRQK
ncbi:MAG TPA: hypothetical protein VFW44_10340 [Bryobacteraceae bacterium]|nr:hypothetical protein [Bryobacteraceae bacterium]